MGCSSSTSANAPAVGAAPGRGGTFQEAERAARHATPQDGGEESGDGGDGAFGGSQGAAVRKELVAIYAAYNPSKLDSIPTILISYDGRW